MQHDFVDSARPREMHPHPLWQMLKLVALPMARSQRIGGIRPMIHGARNLLFGLLAAEQERAVLDLHSRFAPRTPHRGDRWQAGSFLPDKAGAEELQPYRPPAATPISCEDPFPSQTCACLSFHRRISEWASGQILVDRRGTALRNPPPARFKLRLHASTRRPRLVNIVSLWQYFPSRHA